MKKVAGLCVLLLVVLLAACGRTAQGGKSEPPVITSFRQIPGITQEEIGAVESVLARNPSFIYGYIPNIEAFRDRHGDVRGFSALFSEWLSELFETPFYLREFSWAQMLEGLATGEIDFIGNLTPTPERALMYHMTEPIAQRTIKYIRHASSPPVFDLVGTRPLRYAFLDGAALVNTVRTHATHEFEVVYVAEYLDAYRLLRAGEIDALVAESSAQAVFAPFMDIVTEDFFPMLYIPVALTTGQEELALLISLAQRAIENSHQHFLADMYDRGFHEYQRHMFSIWLTDEERAYMEKNPVIPFGAEFDNYPESFFNTRYGQWQGIVFDVLRQVEELTDLQFQVYNDEGTSFSDLLDMLERGEIFAVTELIHTAERRGRFLWPQTAFTTDRYIMISRVDFPNISPSRVHSASVGLARGTPYHDFFIRNFPNHEGYTVYETHEEAFEALMAEEVDLLMSSFTNLLFLLNFRELPGYKVNLMFDETFESKIGFNLEHALLVSIIDKAMELIDTEIITNQWTQRSYDYRARMAEAQRPLFIGIAALSVAILFIAFIFLVRATQSKRAMTNQSHWYKSILDAIPLPVTVTDKGRSLTFVNQELQNFLGVSAGDVLGRHCSVFNLELCGTSDCGVHCYNQGIKRIFFNRGNHYYQVSLEAIADRAGNDTGYVNIIQNITEQRLLSNYESVTKLNDVFTQITKSPVLSTGNLLESAKLVAHEGCHAINASHVSIWLLDNKAGMLRNITCYTRETDEFTVDDDLDLTRRAGYLAALKAERLVAINNVAAHELRDELVNYYTSYMCAMLDAPIKINGVLTGVVCMGQKKCAAYTDMREWTMEEQNFASSLADIMALAIFGAELSKAREAAEAARLDAESANQSKSAFLATMSHEIRTPLNAIIGITEILTHIHGLPEEIIEGLLKIYNSGTLLLGIINDILDFSKIEAGKLDINPAKYCVASLICDSVNLNMMKIDDKPITFDLHFGEQIPAELIGDEQRIKQILNNLLSNAFKYTDEGAVTLTIDTEPWEKGIILVLAVRDTGYGMTEEQVRKLFDEYSRFNTHKTRTVEGTGLGMTITRNLLRLMNGQIFVESEAGVGSLFTVKIPQALVSDTCLCRDQIENLKKFRINYMESRQKSTVIHEHMPYGKVMVVDDVETNLYVAAGLMRPYGLQIETANSGFAAIKNIEAGKEYDIIFMDHMMPEMDGMETVKRLRGMGYSKPIVALTANAVTGQAEIFLQNGFDAFIAKPIDIRELHTALIRFVRDAHPEAAGRHTADTPTDAEKAPGRLQGMTIDGLDIQRGLEKFNGDENTYLKILRSYTSSTLGILEAVKAFDEADMKAYQIAVHSLKGTSLDIFAISLGEQAKALEQAAKDNDTEYIHNHNAAFLADAYKLLEATQQLIDKLDTEAPKPTMPAIDRTLLRTLRDACDMFDMNGAETAMEEINQYKYEDEYELAQWLQERIDVMDYSDVVERVDGLLG